MKPKRWGQEGETRALFKGKGKGTHPATYREESQGL